MRASPSARTIDMITPAPRDRGAAIKRSPTWPSLTRTYSSSPIGDSNLRVMIAVAVGLLGGRKPCRRYSNGRRNNSLVRMAETG